MCTTQRILTAALTMAERVSAHCTLYTFYNFGYSRCALHMGSCLLSIIIIMYSIVCIQICICILTEHTYWRFCVHAAVHNCTWHQMEVSVVSHICTCTYQSISVSIVSHSHTRWCMYTRLIYIYWMSAHLSMFHSWFHCALWMCCVDCRHCECECQGLHDIVVLKHIWFESISELQCDSVD